MVGYCLNNNATGNICVGKINPNVVLYMNPIYEPTAYMNQNDIIHRALTH